MPRLSDSPQLQLPVLRSDCVYVERAGSGPLEVAIEDFCPIFRRTAVNAATFGDSTANLGSTVDLRVLDVVFPGSGATIVSTGTNKLGAVHEFSQLQAIYNAGISGENTTQMLARDAAAASATRRAVQDVLAVRPDVVLLRGASINDLQGVNNANWSATADAAAVRHLQLVSRFVTAGVPVIDSGCFGYGDGALATSATPDAVRSALLRLNTLIKAGLSQFDGMAVYVDPAGVLLDASGRFLPGVTADGLHLSDAGGRLHGPLEALALRRMFGIPQGRSIRGALLFPNIFQTVNSGRPSGFSMSPSGATAVENVQVVDGKNCYTVDVTPTAAGYIYIAAPIPLATMAVNVGDAFTMEYDLDVLASADITLSQRYGRLTLWAPSNASRFISEVNAPETLIPAGTVSRMHGAHIPVRLSVTLNTLGSNSAFEWQVAWTAAAVGKPFQLRLSQPSVVKVTV